MAKLLGVAPPTVNQWVRGVRPVPIEHCPAIELATNGAVTRRDLRPADFHLIWPELNRNRSKAKATLRKINSKKSNKLSKVAR